MTRTGYDAVTATLRPTPTSSSRGDVDRRRSSRPCATCRTSQAADVLAPIGIEVRKGGTSRCAAHAADRRRPAAQLAGGRGRRRARRAAARSRCRPRRRRRSASASATTCRSAGPRPSPPTTRATATDDRRGWRRSTRRRRDRHRGRPRRRLVAVRRRRPGHAADAAALERRRLAHRAGRTTLVAAPPTASAPPTLLDAVSAARPRRRRAHQGRGRRRGGRRSSPAAGTCWSRSCSGSPRSRCSSRRSSSPTRSRCSSRSAPARSRCCAASARARASCARSVLLEAAILGARSRRVAGLVAGLVLGQVALTVLGRARPRRPAAVHHRRSPCAVVLRAAPRRHARHRPRLARAGPRGDPRRRRSRRCGPPTPRRSAPGPVASGSRSRSCSSLGGVGVMLLAAVLSSTRSRRARRLLLGVGALAGALSFVGVLLGAVFWVPKVVSLAGSRARARPGPARGSRRRTPCATRAGRPRRAPPCSSASTLVVDDEHRGRERPRRRSHSELDEHYPVDLMVDGTARRRHGAPGEPTSPTARRRRSTGSRAVASSPDRPTSRLGDDLAHGRRGRRRLRGDGRCATPRRVDGLADGTAAAPEAVADGQRPPTGT